MQTEVDTNTPMPGGGGTFASFANFSVDDGALAFLGAGQFGAQKGIFYLASDATLSSIIGVGDALFGKTVQDLRFGNDALGDSSLDFIATFPEITNLGNMSSVVRADFGGVSVPEPTSLALLGIGIAGLAASRRRKTN